MIDVVFVVTSGILMPYCLLKRDWERFGAWLVVFIFTASQILGLITRASFLQTGFWGT